MDIIELSSIFISKIRSLETKRNFVEKIKENLEKGVLLTGVRGIGKTTSVLQVLMEFGTEKALYLPADHPLVLNNGIYSSYEEALRSLPELNVIAIDEVTQYPKWEKEVKAICDEERVKLIVSGSSSISIEKEAGDLKRRLVRIKAGYMSFKEFLSFNRVKVENVRLGELLENPVRFADISSKVERYFRKYLFFGGFPLFKKFGERSTELIFEVINRIIEYDMPKAVKLESIPRVKKLVYKLALSKPGEFSFESMSREIGASKDFVYRAVDALSKLDVLRIVEASRSGLRKAPKVMFAHPNLRYAIASYLGEEPEIGALREEAVAFKLDELGLSPKYIAGMRKNPDFVVKLNKKKVVFEVGGKSKGKSQIAGFDRGYIISEGFSGGSIPIWLFMLAEPTKNLSF